jgi:hypothetical protein
MGHVKKLLEDRDRCRMTMGALPPEGMARIIEAVKRELGKEPEVDSPTRDLEQFFLQVVEDAKRANQGEQTPDSSMGIANYLLTQKKARPADVSCAGTDTSDR